MDKLVIGDIPRAFPYAYESPFDPSSPYSLIIALYPETRPLKTIDYPQSQLSGIKLDPETCEFIKTECKAKGWLENSESINTNFLKTRMRLQDDFCGDLTLPQGDIDNTDKEWIDGCVKVLKLLRRLKKINMSLRDFEQSDDKTARLVFSIKVDNWDLKQMLQFVYVPYARFSQKVDFLQQYISTLDINELNGATSFPELSNQIAEVCMNASLIEYSNVLHLCENAIPHSNDGSIFELLIALVPVAQSGKINAPNFRTLMDWYNAPKETQQDLLRRTLLQPQHVSPEDITSMRMTIFSKMSETEFIEESIGAALEKTRFMFLKSLPLEQYTPALKLGIMQMVNKFENGETTHSQTAKQLQNILTALDLVDADKELLEIRQKYTRLKKINSTFPSLEPGYILTHEKHEMVSKVLENDNGAYLRYTDLFTLIGEGDKSIGFLIAEQCVESALANDDFDAACEYFERGFINDKSPNAWLAYYQTAKYMSPQWNLTKPMKVLEKQSGLMAKSLNLCPAGDLMSVLSAWSSLEANISEETQRQRLHNGSKTPEPEPEPSDEEIQDSLINQDNPRDQISNLLVSGLGWAIGANPRK